MSNETRVAALGIQTQMAMAIRAPLPSVSPISLKHKCLLSWTMEKGGCYEWTNARKAYGIQTQRLGTDRPDWSNLSDA
jgi:hypothetical protein